MRFVDIIGKKRDGLALTQEEIHYWITNYTNGEIPDYQVSALLMAIVLKGMNEEETTQLTMEMMKSGDILDLSAIDGIKVDKHSTGGVGDKTSLALGPMIAACGVKVAKMSGRGLGHTGGTIDKLEAIEGFNVTLSQADFIAQVNEINIAIVGQTGHLVPADKKLYALRDVTGTVASIPLIASSVMSKKLAAGADAILLDVKYGEGAFMHTPQEAEALARAMIKIGQSLKRDTKAIITDMNQPLGHTIGNALEVEEAIETLQGKGPEDFGELCYQAGSIMLMQANKAQSLEQAREMLKAAIDSGEALHKFKQMVQAQGGNVAQIEDPTLLPKAKYTTALLAKEEGYISAIKATNLGNLAMMLGAGRSNKDDIINPAVGLSIRKKVGDKVQLDELLAYAYHDEDLSESWLDLFYKTYTISTTKVNEPPLIYKSL